MGSLPLHKIILSELFLSDSVKRHLRGRHHLSVLNLKFDFISDGGCTREEQIALSLKRHLFPHGSRLHPPSEIKSNFKFKTLKRHLLKRHLTLSDSVIVSAWGGTESAIPNRESSDSESCDSNRETPRSL